MFPLSLAKRMLLAAGVLVAAGCSDTPSEVPAPPQPVWSIGPDSCPTCRMMDGSEMQALESVLMSIDPNMCSLEYEYLVGQINGMALKVDAAAVSVGNGASYGWWYPPTFYGAGGIVIAAGHFTGEAGAPQMLAMTLFHEAAHKFGYGIFPHPESHAENRAAFCTGFGGCGIY